MCVTVWVLRYKNKKNGDRGTIVFTFLETKPFLELPEFQTFFCPFSVLRIFRFLPLRHLLALPEFVYVDFEGVYSPVTVPFMKVRGKCARQLLHTRQLLLHTHEETLPLTVVACNLPLFSW